MRKSLILAMLALGVQLGGVGVLPAQAGTYNRGTTYSGSPAAEVVAAFRDKRGDALADEIRRILDNNPGEADDIAHEVRLIIERNDGNGADILTAVGRGMGEAYADLIAKGDQAGSGQVVDGLRTTNEPSLLAAAASASSSTLIYNPTTGVLSEAFVDVEPSGRRICTPSPC